MCYETGFSWRNRGKKRIAHPLKADPLLTDKTHFLLLTGLVSYFLFSLQPLRLFPMVCDSLPRQVAFPNVTFLPFVRELPQDFQVRKAPIGMEGQILLFLSQVLNFTFT